jgi:uncharacterized protein YecE (DUF72 family)
MKIGTGDMAEILIGTSGYYYDELERHILPEGLPKKEYLAFYARNYQINELNFTYYKLPEGQADQ